MVTNDMPPRVPAATTPVWRRLLRQIIMSLRNRLNLARLAFKDPILPLVVLGVVGAAFFAVLVLHASEDIVFGILFIGCITAFLETTAGNDDNDH